MPDSDALRGGLPLVAPPPKQGSGGRIRLPTSARSAGSASGLAGRLLGLAFLLLGFAAPAGADPAVLPQEFLDAIHAEAADRILLEDDHGILLIDTKFNPKRIYEPVAEQYRSLLQENVYRDLMRFMEDGQREMVGILLLIKSGSFLWPGGLRFQAILARRGNVVARIPMSSAVYALVEPDDSLDWIELGAGESRVLAPRIDRLVPPQLQAMPQIYRVYMLFPAQVEVDGEYRGWNPLKLNEVTFEPVR